MKHDLAGGVVGILALVLWGCAGTPRGDVPPGPVSVKSYNLMDPAPLNAAVDEGVREGAAWVREPLLIVLRDFSGEDTRNITLDVDYNRVQAADSCVVTRVLEGLADDSLGGLWDQFHLHRTADGSWRCHEVRAATRCARGPNVVDFTKELCP